MDCRSRGKRERGSVNQTALSLSSVGKNILISQLSARMDRCTNIRRKNDTYYRVFQEFVPISIVAKNDIFDA